MSTRRLDIYFRDILDCIAAIEDNLAGMTFDAYQADRKTRHAIERELQILTEAAYRLGDNAALYCPTVPWGQLRGMGNFLRHEYDTIDDTIIWDVIHNRLSEIEGPVTLALKSLQEDADNIR